MKNTVALLTIFLALVSGSLALAQSTGDLGTMRGDVLGGLLSGRQGNENRSWHGHLVQARSTTMIFRAEDGKIYAVDMSAIDTMSEMPGRAAARVNDQGTLTYELGPRQQVTALWLERQETQPSAAVSPRAVGPGEYQRLYGYVQSVGPNTMSFKADDGRMLTVDTSQVDAQGGAPCGGEIS